MEGEQLLDIVENDELVRGSLVREVYGEQEMITERHRHRFEFNNDFKKEMEEAGLVASGFNAQTNLVEIVELPSHPWFIGVQFHPELKSKPFEPHPLFADFVRAAKDTSRLV